MDDASNLNSILRSLLISNPHKTRVSALKRDFTEFYGKEFPYTSFGFKTFYDYLCSIPDVVRIVEAGHPDPTVLPITSDKSSHVESLVMKQKVDKKKTGGSNRGQQRRRPTIPYQYFQNKIPSLLHSNFPKPYLHKENQSQTSINSNIPILQENYSKNQNNSNTSGRTRDLEFVCQDIKRLLITNPSGITFQEMTDFVFLKGKYRDVLVAAGLTTVKELICYCSDFTSVKGNMIFSKWGEKTSVLGHKYTNIGPDEEEEVREEEEEFYNDKSPSPKIECYDNHDKEIQDNSFQEDIRFSVVEDDEDQLGHKVISNFRRILKIYPDGIWCAELPDLYYKEFCAPLDFGEWNYTSVIQMASRLPNVFYYVREGSCSDWKLFDARLKQNCNSNSSEKDKSNLLQQKWIPQSVLDNIKYMLAQHPTGILFNAFYHKFSEQYNIHLKDLGFESIQDFLSNDAIKEILHVREAYNDIYLLPKRVKKTEDDLPIPLVPALPEFQKLLPQLYPKEVCGPDFVLHNYPLDDKVPFVMQVRVTEVSHPGCFWMVPELEWDNLEDMMNDINDFYNKPKTEDRYMMPESTLFKGLLCAAPYGEDSKWHRARIRHYFSMDDEVKIEYIDFGTISVVKKSMLRFLHRDFTSMPQLSIKGKLYGIQSVTPRWPKDTGYHLLDFVSGRSLLAEVCVSKPEESYAEIVLYEAGPDGTKSFIINNYFVSIEVATFIEKGKENGDLVPSVSETKPTIKEGSNFSYQHPENNSVPENTMCMPPRRPPPGFTENDKNSIRSYPSINYNGISSFNYDMMGLVHQNECNPLVANNTGFQTGQHMQKPMMPFGNPLPNNMNPCPYQIPPNTCPYQPTNLMSPTNQLFQLMNSIIEWKKFNDTRYGTDMTSSTPNMAQPLNVSQNLQRPPINRVDEINVPSLSKPAKIEHLPPSPKSFHSDTSFLHNPEHIDTNLTRSNYIRTDTRLLLGPDQVHTDTSLFQSPANPRDTCIPHSSISMNNGSLPHSPEHVITNTRVPNSSKYSQNDISLAHSPQHIITDNRLPHNSKPNHNDSRFPLDPEHYHKHVSSSCYSGPEASQKSNGQNTCGVNMVKSKDVVSPFIKSSTFEERFSPPNPCSYKNENPFETNAKIFLPEKTDKDQFKRNDKAMPDPKIYVNLDRSKTPECWEDLLTEFYDEKLKRVGTPNQQKSLLCEDASDLKSLHETTPVTMNHINHSMRRNTSVVVPPIVDKQACSSSKVTTCLKNIKLDQPEKKECLLKEIVIGSQTVHIMKNNGSVMVSWEEIVKKFTSFNSSRAVMKFLHLKRINFPFSDVFRNQSRELFEELDKSELFILNKSNGLILTKIKVLPLEVVPILLSVLKIKEYEIIDAFKRTVGDYGGAKKL